MSDSRNPLRFMPLRILLVGETGAALRHLEERGHKVFTAEDPSVAADLLFVADIDVLLIEPRAAGLDPLEVLERIRNSRRLQHLEVLLLTGPADDLARLRCLEAGAKKVFEQLPEPVDLVRQLEEVAHSKPGHPDAIDGLLGDGDQEGGLSAALSSLAREGRSGLVQVQTPDRLGWLEIRQGAFTGARLGLLEGKDALLAMLSCSQGRFVFEPLDPNLSSLPPPAGPSRSIVSIVMDADLLRHELERRSEHLPALDVGLRALEEPSPPDAPVKGLPVAMLLERIKILPGVTRRELHGHEAAAPARIDLAIALLIEQGVVVHQSLF